MDFFFEKFLEVSRARWWQVLASVCIVAVMGAMVGMNGETGQPTAAHIGRCALGGGAMGLLGAVFLLWIDAGQRAREGRGDLRLTLRERLMIGCLIFGFAVGAFSLLCGALMALSGAIDFFKRL
jgi:hypothetical protein